MAASLDHHPLHLLGQPAYQRLKIDDFIPPTIDKDILVAGDAPDAWAQEAATMLRTGKVAEAQSSAQLVTRRESAISGDDEAGR